MAKGNTPSPKGSANSGGTTSGGGGTGSAATFPSTAAQRRQMMNTLTQQSYMTSNAVTPNASTPANVLAARSAHQQAISNLQNAISNIPYAASQAQAQSDFNQAYQQYQKTQTAFQNALKAQPAAAPQQPAAQASAAPQQSTPQQAQKAQTSAAQPATTKKSVAVQQATPASPSPQSLSKARKEIQKQASKFDKMTNVSQNERNIKNKIINLAINNSPQQLMTSYLQAQAKNPYIDGTNALTAIGIQIDTTNIAKTLNPNAKGNYILGHTGSNYSNGKTVVSYTLGTLNITQRGFNVADYEGFALTKQPSKTELDRVGKKIAAVMKKNGIAVKKIKVTTDDAYGYYNSNIQAQGWGIYFDFEV